MKKQIQILKGFRDFLPGDMAFQNWFYQNLKKVSESFGFQEYEGPTIEPLELYAAKSGEELVKKQAFTFEDKSGNVVALRPEMTPSLARIVAQNENNLNFPVKWFTYGRRFRYEAPQKGRGREFFQWDIDILGPDSPEADAEIIAIAASFYQKLGLTPDEVKIKINDRKFLAQQVSELGIPEDKFKELLGIIDKKDKVSEGDFKEMLKEAGLAVKQIESLLVILLDKNGYQKSDWLQSIFSYLDKAGLSPFVEYDASIVRGLEYYTRTVFEGWVVGGSFRAIWGGGRYDNLTSDVGSKVKIPGVGFAMGDMVMEEVLKFLNKYPVISPNNSDVLVTVFSPDLFNDSLTLSLRLRLSGLNTELYPDPQAKLDKQLKYADKKQIPYAIILGPEELKSDTVTLKNMSTQSQKKVFTNSVAGLIKAQ
ncbi:MAG TPA: histidine--tRNA ligase [Patescibacteria group bacterium]|nr:histidine--tRNA ligase [Patescibacteria group bacterium]